MEVAQPTPLSNPVVAPAQIAPGASPLAVARRPGQVSALLELALLALVLLALAWLWRGLQAPAEESGVDASGLERYQDDVALRPGPVAPARAEPMALCAQADLPNPVPEKWRDLCTGLPALGPVAASLEPAMADDLRALQAAIADGDATRLAVLASAAPSLAEGVLPPAEHARLRQLSQALGHYREHYQLAPAGSTDSDRAGARPLGCAWQELRQRAASASHPLSHFVANANSLAMLRGQGWRLWWPADAGTANWSPGTLAQCRALGEPQAVVRDAADLAHQVLRGQQWARKAQAMQRLLVLAPALLSLWAVLACLLVKAARRSQHPARHVGWALILWSLAAIPLWWWQPVAAVGLAWVYWPFAPALGLLCLLGAPGLERVVLLAPAPKLHSLSPLSLPLFVGFVGLGWWLVVDLSVHGYPRNRYLALDQTVSVFWAMAVLSVAPVLAPGLATLGLRVGSRLVLAAQRGGARPDGAMPTAAPRPRRWIGAWLRVLLLFALPLLATAPLPANLRQLSGDMLRWAMLPVMAWFLLLRGERWTTDRAGGWRRLLASMAPLVAFIAGTLAALLATDDQGPVLVTLFTLSVFIGALASQAWLSSGRRWLLAALGGLLVAGAVAATLVFALVELPPRIGPVMPFWQERVARIADRVEAMTDPFSAENDQQAMLRWFRRHIPSAGYGLGAVPWCGNQASGHCNGMPAQTQSDYSFTALQGVLGQVAGLVVLAIYLVPWLGMLALRQARATHGRLSAEPGHNAAALLAWLAVCWVCMVAIQTLVTTTGNLGLLPLTGVTWPFVSYGLTSLLGSSVYLGLVMHRLEPD